MGPGFPAGCLREPSKSGNSAYSGFAGVFSVLRRAGLLFNHDQRSSIQPLGASLMPPAVRALLRFWWLVVIGAAVAIVVGGAVYERQPKPTYNVSANVLVNSPEAPYLRTAQPQAPSIRTVGG